MTDALPQAIALFGPTASGKTGLSIKLAQALNGEIINCDSQQVYAELPILTAQPDEAERAGVPHHLFGFLAPDQPLDAIKYQHFARASLEGVLARGKLPIFVGGTGLYFEALQRGLSPLPDLPAEVRAEVAVTPLPELYEELKRVDAVLAERLHPTDTQRIQHGVVVARATQRPLSAWQQEPRQGALPVDWVNIALAPRRPISRARISQRWQLMLAGGVLAEVQTVLAKYGTKVPQGALKSHGIPELRQYFAGEWSLEQAAERIEIQHQQYAKRQRTWLRNQWVAAVCLLQADEKLARCQLQPLLGLEAASILSHYE